MSIKISFDNGLCSAELTECCGCIAAFVFFFLLFFWAIYPRFVSTLVGPYRLLTPC